jgi:hypothetical protein
MKITIRQTANVTDLTTRHGIEEQFDDERTQHGTKTIGAHGLLQFRINDEHFGIFLDAGFYLFTVMAWVVTHDGIEALIRACKCTCS